MPKSSGESSLQPLKRFKKIPVYVVEEHNEALQFIYSAIGGKKLPCEENDDVFTVEKVVESRERQLAELEHIFEHLDEHGNLLTYGGGKTELYTKVSALVDAVTKEAEKLGDAPDWFAVFAGGCTRDQGGLPHHISTEQEMRDMIKESLLPLLRRLPAPVLVTVARSSDDGYCPKHQVDLIQSLVLQILKEVYDIDDPALHYLTVNTN